MEKEFIIALAILVWAFFIFINFTWIGALKEKRGWFKDDQTLDNEIAISFFMVIFAPIAFVFLLLITYIPPLSNWLKTHIKEII